MEPRRYTYGPTKYGWAIENRLDEIIDVRLFKSVRRKLGSLFQEFNLYCKEIQFLPKEFRNYFFHALYFEFQNRIMKSKTLAIADYEARSGIRGNFLKVLKAKIKEINNK